MVVFGHSRYSQVPLRKQALGIPLRPLRYWRRVRAVAHTRAAYYHPTMNDDVS
jgi:hypothetical protein